jgi:hypothetical protein
MSKKVICSWASMGRENYSAGQLKLIKSCVDSGWDGSYVIQSLDGYCDEYMGVKIQIGSYPSNKKYGTQNNHAEIPYGFKVALIQHCIELGYEQIIWADSSIRMLKNPQPLLDYAKEHGVCAWDNLGHPLRFWLTDVAQEHLFISDKELETMKQIMCCCVIFDVTNKKGLNVFNHWLEISRDGVTFQNGYGSTREGFRETRHDQAALSGILFKHNVPLKEYGDGFCYHPHEITKEFGDNEIYLINKGME